MTEVVRFELAEGSTALVEVDDDNLGIERVNRGRDGVIEAGHRLTEALGSVRDAARASREVLQTLSPGPDRVGVRREVGRRGGGDHREDSGRGPLHRDVDVGARRRG